MPIFTRRRMQAMLNELTSHLDKFKGSDLVRRLENKRVEQVLPAEMELALLWALSQLGELEVEPEWFSTSRLPDAYSERLFDDLPAIVEIASISDAGLAQEDDMRRTVSIFYEAANKVLRSSGRHLHFEFRELSGYTAQGYVRQRKVDSGYMMSNDVLSKLSTWLCDSSSATRTPLEIRDGKTHVVITWHEQHQSKFSNFFSSMPAEAYSLTDNPLWSILKAKADQLRSAEFDGIRCLLLGDSGSRLLRRLDDSMRSPHSYTGRQIIESYLGKPGCGLDVICVFSPHRSPNSLSVHREPLTWQMTVFARAGVAVPVTGLEGLRAALPRPRFEGYQARSLQQQAAYSTNARGWYLGTHISSRREKMTISISARALLDLLAGRITVLQFNHMIGMKETQTQKNLFKHRLDQGDVISSVRIESGGIDEDDDRLIIELTRDPAAAPLTLSGRQDHISDASVKSSGSVLKNTGKT
jgi:hypothetical protein